MKQIERTSFGLLIGSVLIAVAILSMYGVDKYLESPSLFISPPESKSRTSVNMVLEAKNLEGLKKICTLWASQEDRANNALNALVKETERVKRDYYILILSVSFVFILGSAHMYIQARKFQKGSENAL